MPTGSHPARLAGKLLLASAVAACGGDDLLLPSSGAPSTLDAVSGDRQEARVGARLPEPLVVQATDAAGRPVVGTRVVFRFDGDVGGEVLPDTTETDAAGRAKAQIRLGTSSGAQLVDAFLVGGADLMVTFRLLALPRPPAGNGGGGGGGGDGAGGGDDGNGQGNGGSGNGGAGGDTGGSGGGNAGGGGSGGGNGNEKDKGKGKGKGNGNGGGGVDERGGDDDDDEDDDDEDDD